MLNADTKRHIDAARQVLVGIVPDPKGQVDQITNALIYKFMDDMDQASLRVKGGKASFFIGDLEQYAWTRLMDPSLGNQGRMNLYVEALAKFGEAKQLPELFRDIFKRAFLPFRDPETLGLFLKEIAYFDYSHSEELGNAYEYLLSVMGSQGDAGQFRTPRHIIDFIVAAVEPTKDDTILDPACGTAGFLISAYKHIVSKHDGKDEKGEANKEIPLTPDERKRLMEHFEGYDISPDMVRMSQVNMYLHAFKGPKIYEYNALASEDRWNDKFDVILANPPFMSPRGGVRPHQRFSVESTRAEVLFVDYIMNHLKPRGRAGVIVPEGIIFQSGIAYKQLRKNLVDDGLYAVVSLPAGVFNPYSGVKTSILLFDRELAKRATELLFIKVTNDGFDLGAQRREHTHNDLPQALEILHKWKSDKKVESAMALYVEKSRVAETGDYNLSADRYRVVTDYGTAKWPMAELGTVCEILNGYAFKSENYVDNGVRVIRITNVQKGEIVDDNPKFYPSDSLEPIERYQLHQNDLLISLTGNVGRVGLMQNHLLPAALNQRVACLRGSSDSVDHRYLFHFLNQDEFEDDCIKASSGVAQKNLSTTWLSKYKIPLPPLEIQQQIVAELDGYAGIIAGAKQVVENWKPKIDIDPEWKKVKLGEVCEQLFAGGDVPKDNYSLEKNGKHQIPIYTNGINEKSLYGFTSLSRVENESVTISARGTIGYSEVRKAPFYPAVRLIVATPNTEKIGAFFLKYSLDGLDIYRNGNSIPQLTIPMIANEEISLPPLEVQKQIVEQIEAERTIVESSKKLIAIYEQKTKDSIAKLWSE